MLIGVFRVMTKESDGHAEVGDRGLLDVKETELSVLTTKVVL